MLPHTVVLQRYCRCEQTLRLTKAIRNLFFRRQSIHTQPYETCLSRSGACFTLRVACRSLGLSGEWRAASTERREGYPPTLRHAVPTLLSSSTSVTMLIPVGSSVYESQYDPAKVLEHPEFRVLDDGAPELTDKSANIACAYNPAHEIHMIHKPTPKPRAGEVIVHVRATGICG